MSCHHLVTGLLGAGAGAYSLEMFRSPLPAALEPADAAAWPIAYRRLVLLTAFAPPAAYVAAALRAPGAPPTADLFTAWLLAVSVPSAGLIVLALWCAAGARGLTTLRAALRSLLGATLLGVGVGLLGWGVAGAPNPSAPIAAMTGALALISLWGLWPETAR